MSLWDDYRPYTGLGLIDSMKPGPNPADAANKYISQIPGQTKPYFDPYIDQGKNMLHQTGDQYTQLMNDPGKRMNDIGASYHQSPGFKFAMDQAMQASGHAAAAGGMAGSPEHEFRNQETATGLADQDYNQWMQHALGLYGEGLHGGQDQAHMGLQAGTSMADMIAQALAQQGQLAYTGQQNQNQQKSSMFNNVLQGAGTLAAFA